MNKQIAQMAKETGIPAEKIQSACMLNTFAIELTGIKTVTEARKMLKKYRTSSYDSNQEQAILEKWLEAASTKKEIKELYNNTSSGKLESSAIVKLAKLYGIT